jgi:uncharacterized protein (TIGR02246 family)
MPRRRARTVPSCDQFVPHAFKGPSRFAILRADLHTEVNMKRPILLGLLALLAVSAPALAQQKDDAEALIEREQQEMLDAWNRNDLDAHLKAYALDATWTTSNGLLHGKEAIKQSLIKGFKRGDDLLGDLEFGKSEYRRLSADVMMSHGSFRVFNLPSGKEIKGQSTLLWKRVDGKWLIVHDHSS